MIDPCKWCKDHVVLISGVSRIERYHTITPKVTIVFPTHGICPEHIHQLPLATDNKIVEKARLTSCFLAS